MRRGLHHPAGLASSARRSAAPSRCSSSQRPSGAGSVSAISCTRGCRNSAISTIWPSAALHLGAHAGETARPDLQLGDADGVLVGHAERKLARGLGQQAPEPSP